MGFWVRSLKAYFAALVSGNGKADEHHLSSSARESDKLSEFQ